MLNWREHKRAMRRDVHQTMLVPALYLASRTEAPIAVTVRDHTKFGGVADVSGAGEGFAQMLDTTPRLRFLLSEIGGKPPKRGGIVSIAVGEAYTIGASRPPDDEYIYAEVAPLSAAEAQGLPVPA